VKAQEGIGRQRRLTPVAVATGPGAEQGPEGGAKRCGARAGNRRAALQANDKRARAVDETVRLRRGQTPWRANPGRGSGVKQTRKAGGGEAVEGVRNAEDGTEQAVGSLLAGRRRLTSRRGKKPPGRHLHSPAGVKGVRSGSDSAGERKLMRG